MTPTEITTKLQSLKIDYVTSDATRIINAVHKKNKQYGYQAIHKVLMGKHPKNFKPHHLRWFAAAELEILKLSPQPTKSVLEGDGC